MAPATASGYKIYLQAETPCAEAKNCPNESLFSNLSPKLLPYLCLPRVE